MTPAEIARRLTPAQRRALLWLPGDGTMRRRQRKGQPIPHGCVLDVLCRKVLAARVALPGAFFILTPLGAAVRTEIKKESDQ